MNNYEMFDVHNIEIKDFEEVGKYMYRAQYLLMNLIPELGTASAVKLLKAAHEIMSYTNLLSIFSELKHEPGTIQEDMNRRKIAMGYRMSHIMLQELLIQENYEFSINMDMTPDTDKSLIQRIVLRFGRENKAVRDFTLEELMTLESLKGEVQ